VHGQKKRRKRSLEGKLSVGDMILNWQLISEPLWSTDHGYKGLCISVALDGQRAARGLILQYPYPTNEQGSPLPLPQRPKLSDKMIESGVQQALGDGWKPDSRGKQFVFEPLS
jgi:hypothetical protein